jgi:hypothetical protein
MKKVLIPFLLFTGLLFLSSGKSVGFSLGTSSGATSAGFGSDSTIEGAHIFKAGQPFERGLSFLSEVIDIEEEEDIFEGHSSSKKELRPEQNFKSSAAFYFGYLSRCLAYQAKLDFTSRAKYIVQQVFRL